MLKDVSTKFRNKERCKYLFGCKKKEKKRKQCNNDNNNRKKNLYEHYYTWISEIHVWWIFENFQGHVWQLIFCWKRSKKWKSCLVEVFWLIYFFLTEENWVSTFPLERGISLTFGSPSLSDGFFWNNISSFKQTWHDEILCRSVDNEIHPWWMNIL